MLSATDAKLLTHHARMDKVLFSLDNLVREWAVVGLETVTFYDWAQLQEETKRDLQTALHLQGYQFYISPDDYLVVSWRRG